MVAASSMTTQLVVVDELLAIPDVSCATTQTSITFSWPDVPGATGYDIIEITGPSGTLDRNIL